MNLSKLGFGASPLGGAFGEIDEQEGIRAVHRALDLGVTYFDVSPYYGMTRAETVLGKAMRGIPRESFRLSTKVGRYGNTDFDFSASRVRRSIDESRQRLGVEYIDLVLCHDIEFVRLDQVVDEAIPTLRRLQAEGAIGAIGVSGLPLTVYSETLRRTALDAILSYCHYTLFDTSLNGLIDDLDARDAAQKLTVINAAPLSMGLLSNSGGPPWHPADAETKRLCARAAEHCRARGSDISRLALQFAVANPSVDSTLVGMGDRATVEKNVNWTREPIDEQLLKEVHGILAPVRNRTWPSGKQVENG